MTIKTDFIVREPIFEKFIKEEAVYVDKTGMILDLFNNADGPYFLSRPRRFGKSLLLDTIQNVAEGKKWLFDGLEIGDPKRGYDWNHYPVVHIDMSGHGSQPLAFESSLVNQLNMFAGQYGVNLGAMPSVISISSLIQGISIKSQSVNGNGNRADPQNVVLLIDEYDSPLISNIKNPKNIESFRVMLYDFYKSVKSVMKFIRLAFITGVTKFRQLSLFSAMNNINDITFNRNYNAICGFTENEIGLYFRKHFKTTLSELKRKNELAPGSTTDDLMGKLMEWYNGYSWGGNHKVLNPYSVMNFFEKKSYNNYWYQSGTSLIASELGFDDSEFYGMFKENLSFKGEIPIIDTQNIFPSAFFLQAGYLTVSSSKGSGTTKIMRLKIPNNEVKNAIAFELFVLLLKAQKKSDPFNYISEKFHELYRAFSTLNVDLSERLLASIFSSIPSNLHDNRENIYHIILYIILCFGTFLPDIESFTDKGRSDLVLRTPKGDWIVIEVKHVKARASANIVNISSSDDYEDQSSSSVKEPSSNNGDFASGDIRQVPKAGTVSSAISGHTPKSVISSLNSNIDKAFRQIISKNYAKQFLGTNRDVYAAAVAIYGTSTLMIRFGHVEFSSEKDNKEVVIRKLT
ncbi:MAG: AAA family ATPase [Deltaproteobacteria bacterium]|jgi:hypothetical protein|nr:AAA family ATPase [Deltaproteobacteria bacterium]